MGPLHPFVASVSLLTWVLMVVVWALILVLVIERCGRR